MNSQYVKRAVRERDGNCCTVCGITNKQSQSKFGKSLEVHRLKPGSEYTLEGCVTLCHKCHGPQRRLPHGARGVIQLPPHLRQKAHTLAAAKGVKLSALLMPLIETYIEAEYDRVLGDLFAKYGASADAAS